MPPRNNFCGELHETLSRLQRFTFPFDPDYIPRNGIYILYEQGEFGHGGDKIVRVGTHTGDNQLRSRLQQHYVKENKDRSIFRKNIGRALLNRDDDPFLEHWEIDLTTRKARERYAASIDRDKQLTIERRVSDFIQGNFSFVVLPVSNKEERLSLEAKMISTISWCEECRPSADWLGLHSPKRKIRESGLWLVNELYKEPLTEEDLKRVNEIVRSTLFRYVTPNMTNTAPKYRGTKQYLLVYAEIIRAAQFRGIVTYQEIADIVGLPLTGNYMGKEIGILLGEIVEDELAQDRPILTAVVVSSEGLPDPGFYIIAKQIGKYRGDSRSDERRFWEVERQAVYKAWQRELKGPR